MRRTHCHVLHSANTGALVLVAEPQAVVHVNGDKVTPRSHATVVHGDLIMLGDIHMFRVVHPRSARAAADTMELSSRTHWCHGMRQRWPDICTAHGRRTERGEKFERGVQKAANRVTEIQSEVAVERRQVKKISGRPAEMMRRRVERLEHEMRENASSASLEDKRSKPQCGVDSSPIVCSWTSPTCPWPTFSIAVKGKAALVCWPWKTRPKLRGPCTAMTGPQPLQMLKFGFSLPLTTLPGAWRLHRENWTEQTSTRLHVVEYQRWLDRVAARLFPWVATSPETRIHFCRVRFTIN